MTAQVSSEASHAETLQDEVLAEVRNHIGHLTLNRPAGLNAITLNMVRRLASQLKVWADDPQVYAVVLRGAGGVAVAPGAGTDPIERAITGAVTGQALIAADPIFDETLAPG